MVQKLFDVNAFIYIMLGICLVGMGIKCLVYSTYKRLIRASDDMGNSQNKLMKVLCLKFEAYYKLKIGVKNVDALVDKYVYKYRVGKVLLSTWENLGGQALISCLLIGTVAGVLGVAAECGQAEVLSTVFIGALTSAVLIAVENLMNLNNKRTLLRTYMKDYLENYLKARLENEHLHPEAMEKYRNEYFERVGGEGEGASGQMEGKSEDKAKAESKISSKEDVKELLESIEAMAAEQVKEGLLIGRKQALGKEGPYAVQLSNLSKKDEKVIEEILKEYLT